MAILTGIWASSTSEKGGGHRTGYLDYPGAGTEPGAASLDAEG